MLHYKTIESGTLQLLKELQSKPVLQGMRLVGGTGLALHGRLDGQSNFIYDLAKLTKRCFEPSKTCFLKAKKGIDFIISCYKIIQ